MRFRTVIAAALCAIAPAAHAQPDMDPGQIIEMMKASAEPTAMHDRIARLAGHWDVELRFQMAPGAPPEVSKGSATNTMIMGGRFLKTEVETDFVFAGRTLPMAGMGVIGVRTPDNQVQSVWMDTLGTYMMFQTGEFTDDDTFQVTGTSQTPFGPQTLRNIYKVSDGPDRIVMEFHEGLPDGTFAKTGEAIYTRADHDHGRNDADHGHDHGHAPQAARDDRPAFIYFIEPARGSAMLDAPTPAEMTKVAEHFAYLNQSMHEGDLLLAGPSTEPPYTGVIVFHADDPAAARRFAENDPAVKAGVFTMRMAPFRVSLHAGG